MTRTSIDKGVNVTQIDPARADKFKRFKINIHMILPGERATATAMALLPHLLERRCQSVPDAMQLSRRLFGLYGAELTGESYTAGQNRVVTVGITGLKNEFALDGEDIAGEALDLLLDLLFAPYLENGVFAAEDVAIEAGKQAEHLRNEMNDKRGYCVRQARRKLYGDTPLGIESSGYLEDIDGLTPKRLYAAYADMLRRAAIEVVVCGADGDAAAKRLAARLGEVERAPAEPAPLQPAGVQPAFEHFSEAMDTAQGKLCILLASGEIPGAGEDAVMRMASAALGGLASSRLFRNVREKQSLCYYCTSIFGPFSGTLQMDSGVDHANAEKAEKAMLHELQVMQTELITEEELENARLALENSFKASADSPDALAGWAFNEWLRGTNQTLEQAAAKLPGVTREQIRDALAKFTPCVAYTITEKEGA